MTKTTSLLTFIKNNLLIAGCDEAGRGPLAGPVFAAAVILPKDFSHPLLNDSKQLSEKKRNTLRPIIEQNAVAWSVAMIDIETIEKINILNSSIRAMHLALEQLTTTPQYILVDGNRFKPFNDIPYETVVKGDGKYKCIAAASILAKTYRDDYMLTLHNKHPQYQWNTNKGYGTKQHRDAILRYGITPHHRKSFLGNLNQQKILF
jgi:ribonuclease HII